MNVYILSSLWKLHESHDLVNIIQIHAGMPPGSVRKPGNPISQIAERIKPCSYSKKLNQCNKIIPQVYNHSRCTGSQSNHNRSTPISTTTWIVGGFKLRIQCIDFGLLALEVDFWRESISHRALLCISTTRFLGLKIEWIKHLPFEEAFSQGHPTYHQLLPGEFDSAYFQDTSAK